MREVSIVIIDPGLEIILEFDLNLLELIFEKSGLKIIGI